MKKALFAYNPMSGNRFVPQNLDAITKCFQKEGVYLELYRISEKDRLIEYIKYTKADFIIGAGGDGTLSQIITSMVRYGIYLPFMALGTGTSNNFTRNLDASKSITTMEQAEKIIHDSCNGTIQTIDVGLINKKQVFLTSLAGGNFVDTTFETDKKLKQRLGPLAYYLKPLTELTNIKAYPIKVTVDQVTYEEKVSVFVMVNGNAVGTFDKFIDNADMADGVMELILITEATMLENISLFRTILTGEDINAHKNIKILKGKKFHIECGSNMPITLDGEKGPVCPLDVEVIHRAIQVYVAQ